MQNFHNSLDFKRANFDLFEVLLGGRPCVRALEGRGGVRELVNIQASLHSSLRSVHPYEQEVKQKSRRPSWLSKELLTELKWKREVYGKRDRPLGKNIGTLLEYAGMW